MSNAAASLRRYAIVLLVSSMMIVLASWVSWIAGVIDSKGTSDPNGNPVGVDYAIFHTGGRILAEGNQESLYDETAFLAELSITADVDEPTSSPTFVNPPIFAAVFMPLADVEYRTGLAIWSTIGLVALGVSIRLIGPRMLIPAVAASLLFHPVFVTFRLGQNSLVSLLLLSACLAALSRGNQSLAGIVLGLLVYKPQLALGVAIWWTVDWQTYRRAWISALTTATSLIAIGWLLWPEATSAYFGGFRDLVTTANPGFLRSTFSPYGFFAVLLPGNDVAITVLTVLSAVAGLAWFLSYWQNHRVDLTNLFALAVILSLWLAPRVVVYDWTLLLIPAFVLVRQRSDLQDTWLLLSAVITMAAATSRHFTVMQLDSWGRAIQVAVPILALAAIGATRALAANPPRTGEPDPEIPSDQSLPGQQNETPYPKLDL